MSLAQQGKFDELSKRLITHVLGFEEGEENFIRSEQYVLSNLLYHHCLAVNSHAVRRSIDGLVLKFNVHGQQHRAQQLQNLTSRFLVSPFFKDHDEIDIEWSLLSLLLRLSNSPTQVPVSEEEIYSLHKNSSPVKSHSIAEEDIDWVAYLRHGEPEYIVGSEQPLSDWSSDDEGSDREEESIRHSPFKTAPSLKETSKPALQPTPQELLEQSHRAQSWLAANTHTQYWGSKKYYQCTPSSSHPAASAAKLWEAKFGTGSTQQLSEWAVMREIVWVLMCPAASHIFQHKADVGFAINPDITIPSLTPGAAKRLLAKLCGPLNDLLNTDTFLRKCEESTTESSFPVTLKAYATGLRLWRQDLLSKLCDIEYSIKKQESTCTMSWLEGELDPWLCTLSSIVSVNSATIDNMQYSPREIAIRLINALCDSVESAGMPSVRCVLLRLLMHTLRHYLSIINNMLLHGSLKDHAQEFIIERNDSVSVKDEIFWHDAFILNPSLQSEGEGAMSLKFLSPLAGALATVGKSCELLAVLDAQPLLSSSSILHTHEKTAPNPDMLLEDLIVRNVQATLYGTGAKDESTANKDSMTITKIDQLLESQYYQVDPLLLAAFTESDEVSGQNSDQRDSIIRIIESMMELPHAISITSVLSSAIKPLIREKEVELSLQLTNVLLEKFHLDQHCQAVRSILLMEAGDIMHDFYTVLFSKIDSDENIDEISLTLHLQDCTARLRPELAQLFSVSIGSAGNSSNSTEETRTALQNGSTDAMQDNDFKQVKIEEEDKGKLKKSNDAISVSLSKAGLPDISISYQAPYPVTLVLTEKVLNQYNTVFQFCLNLKRAKNGLERLKFKDLASWHAVIDLDSATDVTAGPLQSRLHRLQLLRMWLLCFTRELHDHIAHTALLPFHQNVEKLFLSRPPLNTIITEHDKLLNRLITNCLMGNGKTLSPLQIVLNKVFWLSQRLAQLWMRDIGRVTSDELTAIENQYAQIHRYLANFLSRLTTTNTLPHLEGLTRNLVDTVPLLTQP